MNTRAGLIVDNFAGGGGASSGIEHGLGRPVDIAINHDAAAVDLHKANHPWTRHLQENVFAVDPYKVCGGRPVDLAWFSPDCTHFSKAKGGRPRKKKIRGLAWVVVRWARTVRPKVIILENVEEFEAWGPLAKNGQPCSVRKGQTFRFWVKQLERHGYTVEWRTLRACDYGAPTIRKRLFLVARCDGEPIRWPAPTHGAGLEPYRTAAEIIDWSLPCPSIFLSKEEGRAAGVKRPLADATMRRIARGVMKYVVNAKEPFIVPVTHPRDSRVYGVDEPMRTVTCAPRGEFAVVAPHMTYAQHGGGVRSAEDPLHTVTASPKDYNGIVAAHITKFRGDHPGNPIDEPLRTVTANSFHKRPGGAPTMGLVAAHLSRQFGHSVGSDMKEPAGTVTAGGGGKTALVGATLVQTGYGERNGQAPRVPGLEKPLGTVVTTPKHGLVAAFMAQHNTGLVGHDAREPISTVVEKGCTQALVAANLSHQYGSASCGGQGDPAKPLKTVTTGGHHALVASFLTKYYGTDQDPRLEEPLHTVTTKDRFGLVTVDIGGEEYVITDIGMRMLTPRELYRAQGFEDSYIIRTDGMTKTQSIALCGNSVPPPLAAAVAAANVPAQRKRPSMPLFNRGDEAAMWAGAAE